MQARSTACICSIAPPVNGRAECWPMWYQCFPHLTVPYWDTQGDSSFTKEAALIIDIGLYKVEADWWECRSNYCLFCKDRKFTAVEPLYGRLNIDEEHFTPQVFKCNEQGAGVVLEHYQSANKTPVYSVLSGNTLTIMQIHGRTTVFVTVNSYSSLFSVTQAVKIPPLRSVYVNRNHKIYRKSAAKNV